MKTVSKTSKFLMVAFTAAALAASSLATTPSAAQWLPPQLVYQWLINACMGSGGNPAQCPCYAQIMQSNSTTYDQSEMLQGRITPNMNALHPRAMAQCGM